MLLRNDIYFKYFHFFFFFKPQQHSYIYIYRLLSCYTRRPKGFHGEREIPVTPSITSLSPTSSLTMKRRSQIFSLLFHFFLLLHRRTSLVLDLHVLEVTWDCDRCKRGGKKKKKKEEKWTLTRLDRIFSSWRGVVFTERKKRRRRRRETAKAAAFIRVYVYIYIYICILFRPFIFTIMLRIVTPLTNFSCLPFLL